MIAVRPYHITLAACLLALLGCDPPQSTHPRQSQSKAVRLDNLKHAMDLLDTADQGSSQDLNEQIVSYLNRWANEQPPVASWKQAVLIERIPAKFQRMREISTAALSDKNFGATDVTYLQQARQMKVTSSWVTRKPTPKYLVQWSKQKGLSPDVEQQLFMAERIFDWTVRNVQLTALPPHPDRGNTGPVAATKKISSGASEAKVGPGYMHRPLETLLYGFGDSYNRAQIFILLTRQQGLETVMLATRDKAGTGSVEPWIPAVRIEDELYLFDTQLGLPIPDESGQGIATLKEVLGDKNLLRNLDMSEELTYRIANKQLEKIYALLNASPTGLSLRMEKLQNSLTGNSQLSLFVDVDDQHDSLVQLDEIDDALIWTISLENILYRDAVKQRIAKDRDLFIRVNKEQRAFIQTPQLSQGRIQQVSGRFESKLSNMDERAVVGAKEMLLPYQMSHKRLMALPRDQAFLEANGLVPGPNETPQEHIRRVQTRIFDLMVANHHTSFWLAGIHYEMGNYEAAARWFEERVLDDVRSLPGLEEPLTNPWAYAARYNIGRCHEELGNTEEAQRYYRADTSAQKHGCLLRARQLRQRTETQSDDDTDAPDDA